ncbi:MAG: twin-arginine translocase subunit TatC [Planctomycetes bacterium]|nr:twin-arginine translocase subunit TatC [Planctomycetota bacterium]
MVDEPEDDPVEASRMTLGEHLDELRVRLIRSAIALTILVTAGWIYHDQLADVVLAPGQEKAIPWLNEALLERKVEGLLAGGAPKPEAVKAVFDEGAYRTGFQQRLQTTPLLSGAKLDDEQRKAAFQALLGDEREGVRAVVGHVPSQLRSDAASAGFMFYLKVCVYFALFVGGPYVLWQLWAFVAAGLYKHERRVVYLYAPFSMLLFLAGVVFGYFYMVPYALYFLAEMGIEEFQYDLRLELYLEFFTKLSLGLGVVFQLPILMIVLTRTGLVEPSLYSKYRPHFIVGALIVAAILTPPDPYTQLMMGVPLIVLFEVGIWLARLAHKKAAA